MERQVRRHPEGDEPSQEIGARIFGFTLCRDLTSKWQESWLCRDHALHCREIITDRFAKKGSLIASVENLWDKYAVPSCKLEQERTETLKTLNGYLKALGYLGGEC